MSRFTTVFTVGLALCLLATLPTHVAAATNTTCNATSTCGTCVGNGCGFCKRTSMCMEGTTAGSFDGLCSGSSNWTWFAQDCASNATCTQYVCPDGQCAANLAACNCTKLVNGTMLSVRNDNGNTSVPMSLNADIRLNFTARGEMGLPAGPCGTFNWVQYFRMEFLVIITRLGITNLTVQANIMDTRVSFPAGTFVPGTEYTITAKAYDVLNRTSMTSFMFTAVSSTPVITVKTPYLLSLPLNARLIVDIADPNGITEAAQWYCIAEGQANTTTCPANITSAMNSSAATATGLVIAGPIPAGVYKFYVIYKTVRSANMTLNVTCNAADLVDGRCPGKCVYTCPDTTCAISLTTCNCTQFATVNDAMLAVWPVRADTTKVLANEQVQFTATATYRQKAGSCASFDFTPFMTMKWTMVVGSSSATEVPIPGGIRDNVSRVTIPASTFTVGTTYRFIARFYKIDKSVGDSVSYLFTASAPAPTVQIGGGASKLVVGPTNIRVTATVVDAYDNTTVGTWACTGVCGSALTAALSSGNNSLLVIAGPVATGVSMLTLTYKGVTSASLTLDVQATEVPAVQIEFTTDRAIMPNTYLYTQAMGFRAIVTYGAGATTLQWKVNNRVAGASDVLLLAGIDLVQSTLSQTIVNNVTLRATSTANTAIYGEGSFTVIVAVNQTVTINPIVNVNNASNPLLALSDFAQVSYTTAGVSGQTVSYEVGYVDGSSKIVKARTGDLTASFVTPIPPGGLDVLNAYVDVFVNSYFAGTANRTYAVRMPAQQAAVANQLAALESATDPVAKAAALANLGSLLARETTPDPVLASQVLSGLTSIAGDSNVPADVLISAGQKAAAASGDSNSLIAFAEIVAEKVDASNAQGLLDIVGSVPPSPKSLAVVGKMLDKVAETVAVGQTVTFTSGATTATVEKKSGSSIAASSSSAGSSKMTFGAAMPGVNPTDTVVVSGSSSTVNVYGAKNGVQASTPVTTVTIGVNGAKKNVTGLSSANRLIVTMNSANPARDVCQYWNEATSSWSTVGVEKVSYALTTIDCATEHLTAFAGFAGSGSSSGRVVVSALVVALVALLQVAFRA